MRARPQLLAALAEAQPDQADIAQQGAQRSDRRRTDGPGAAASRGRSRRPSCRPTRGCCSSPTRSGAGALERALPWLAAPATTATSRFLAPLITRLGRGRARRSQPRAGERRPDRRPTACSAPLRDEEQALILLKFRRTADAEPFARRAIGSAGARETRLQAGARRRLPCRRRPRAGADDARGHGRRRRRGAPARSSPASRAAQAIDNGCRRRLARC